MLALTGKTIWVTVVGIITAVIAGLITAWIISETFPEDSFPKEVVDALRGIERSAEKGLEIAEDELGRE